MRLKRGFGPALTSLTSDGIVIHYLLDGRDFLTADVTNAFGSALNGWFQATELLRLVSKMVQLFPGALGYGTGNSIRVAYDSSTDEFVINDLLGRQIEFVSWVVDPLGNFGMSEILYNNPTYTRPSKIDGLIRNPFPIKRIKTIS